MIVSAIALSVALAGAATSGKCDVLDYASWREAPDQQWDFRSAKLTLIGAEHVRDPAHEQFPRIAAAFAEIRPSLVLFEGPDRGVKDSAEETIRSLGESGYVRFLAKENGVPARSLEPSPSEQVKMLLTKFPSKSCFSSSFERQRACPTGKAAPAQRYEAVIALLDRMKPMAEKIGVSSLNGLQSLEAAAARYWPSHNWRSLPADWFSPGTDDRKTGSIFTGAINRADSTNRDLHMVKMIGAALKAGERPLVVVGRNHVPMQAPALACLLSSK